MLVLMAIVIVVIAVMIVAIMVVPAVAVPVVVVVPAVVVLKTPAVAVPVTREVTIAVVVGHHPTRTRIRRARPIAGMPPVVPAHRVPVAFDPHEVRSRAWRNHRQHAGRRGRSDLDSHGNLCVRCRCRGKQKCRSQDDLADQMPNESCSPLILREIEIFHLEPPTRTGQCYCSDDGAEIKQILYSARHVAYLVTCDLRAIAA